ncbi:MAG: hypothetical protein R2761_07735 [Acidimicrobiales bacterium]
MRARNQGRMGGALLTGPALVLLVAAACSSSPAPIEIGDIELPPGLETYAGPAEPTVSLVLNQVTESLPDGASFNYAVYTPTAATDLDQWFSGSLSRAGFKKDDVDDFLIAQGRWERGHQTFTWSSIPLTSNDAATDLVVIMLATR